MPPMNAAFFNRNSPLVVYGLPLLIIVFAASVGLTSATAVHPELAAAVAFDLLVTAPLAYLFLIRKKNISKLSVLPFFVGGLSIAALVLPAERQYFLDPVKLWVLPAIELIVLALTGRAAWQTLKKYRSLKRAEPDVPTVFREICREKLNFPILPDALAFEVSVLYFAFVPWRKPAEAANRFTSHRTSGIIPLLAVLIFLLTVETIVLHVFVSRLSHLAAWAVTASSLYVSLQLLAHLKALYLRRAGIDEKGVFIPHGIFGDTVIDPENIAEIRLTSDPPEKTNGVRRIALLKDFEPFNVRIELKHEETFTGFYGVKSKYRTLLLFIDEKEKFKNLIEKGS
ncbi:MAG: hypothetical protein R2747_23670 [Pyrinomonadaceae bacterium]